MQGFHLYIERKVNAEDLKKSMREIFPGLNFFKWTLNENIIDGRRDRELHDKDILFEISNIPGIFKTLIIFYRFPGEEASSRLDLYIGGKLSKQFDCKVTIDGYSYCNFDQMPDYSLLLENGKAYLIGDCYPDPAWHEDDPRIKTLSINILEEIEVSMYQENYDSEAIQQ